MTSTNLVIMATPHPSTSIDAEYKRSYLFVCSLCDLRNINNCLACSYYYVGSVSSSAYMFFIMLVVS